jgi:hypothetical protein
MDRHLLDESIFPLSHHEGELSFTPNMLSKKYSPARPLKSPYSDHRIITNVQPGSQFTFAGGLRYEPLPEGDGVIEIKHYLGVATNNRVAQETLISGTKDLISKVGENRQEKSLPSEEIEIITLGTGSAVPNKYRNGI